MMMLRDTHMYFVILLNSVCVCVFSMSDSGVFHKQSSVRAICFAHPMDQGHRVATKLGQLSKSLAALVFHPLIGPPPLSGLNPVSRL